MPLLVQEGLVLLDGKMTRTTLLLPNGHAVSEALVHPSF